jgi:hypothetical protein
MFFEMVFVIEIVISKRCEVMENSSEECIPTVCCVEEHHSLGGRRLKLLHYVK